MNAKSASFSSPAFEIELQPGVELDKKLAGSFFNLLVDLMLDSVDVIKFFRKVDAMPKANDAPGVAQIQNVRAKVEHLKRVAEVQRMTRYNPNSGRPNCKPYRAAHPPEIGSPQNV